ncbi:flagellar protein FlgN [Curtobacterium sp. MCBD17_034]|uniref:flagellar protein FlgN n=1 Tax=unclassified Curtobacterium TaxID=257496 RepID=UPI000DA8D228|nr:MULTISPECIES: flagellar protein FlgN [unclassified Curtobacterium]PZE75795.1 flagellar protein FlgN [Curtobacterium sp. MCBD17_019]PZF60843.1 flagellar protein FlgN [Curtobacterium sp. MCBD17_034]PZF66420.1 flagellar protein FlgN [Curtobacterium sp. MCBD17_013]PZM40192.1 flagellar protein FlgN [Curtobacterium sp. MCBD17_031]WIB64997.1 flagellar protein FlgN [Curtobacterium sp. MCBD17_040]
MGMNELSAVLWRERELLELLTFKLEEEQLLLTAGRSRWVDHASREVEQVLERLRAVGLERSVESAAVAEQLGAPTDAPLREIVSAAAPEGPWGEILAAHLRAMIELTAQVAALRDENERFLRAAARATQETLAGAVGEVATYDGRGSADAGAAGAHFFDGSL